MTHSIGVKPRRILPPRSGIVGPMIEPAGHPVFPTPLDAYPVVDGGLLATLAARLRRRSVQRRRHRHLRAGDPAHVRWRRVSRRWPTTCSTGTTSGARAEGLAPQPSVRGRAAALPRRGRGRLRPLGGRAAGRDDVAPRAGTPPRTTSTTRSTTPSRCSSSSSWRWPRRGRSSGSPRPRCGASPALGGGTPAAWWLAILTIGPLLGSFITEPAAMTICALLLARQFYDLQPVDAAEVRDARPAVRQRLDRRHADALRRAAGADGRAPVGLGHAVHARPLRLARGRWRSSCRTPSTSSLFRRELAALADAAAACRRRTAGRGRRPGAERCCRCRRGSPSSTCCSWRGRSSTRTTRRCSSAASCSSSASPRRPPPYQSRIELQGAAAGRLLPRRAGHPRRPAGLVDRAGAGEPVGRAAVLRRRRC